MDVDAEAPCFYIFLHALLQVATKMWRRQITPYLRYPWRLAKLADPRITDESSRLLDEFRALRPCCCDEGLTLRLRDLDLERQKDKDLLQGVAQMISHSKCLNAEIEDNFARCHSQSRAARGSLAKLLLVSLATCNFARNFRSVSHYFLAFPTPTKHGYGAEESQWDCRRTAASTFCRS